jgi:very-short-patch-repair endonuclease
MKIKKDNHVKGSRSYLEEQFERGILRYGLPQPVREFVFHRWRFDFAWPKLKIAVEVDGGTWVGGEHVRGRGYQRDCRKNNAAQIEGWAVLRADREMVFEEDFFLTVKAMISRRVREWQRRQRDGLSLTKTTG